MSRLYFGSTWEGKWPYPGYRGVGIRLQGYPTDVQGLTKFLHDQSCNPIAVLRHLEILKAKRIVRTTLQAIFDFEELQADFANFGVRMTVIRPCAEHRINDQSKDQEEMHARLATGALKPENIGRFAP